MRKSYIMLYIRSLYKEVVYLYMRSLWQISLYMTKRKTKKKERNKKGSRFRTLNIIVLRTISKSSFEILLKCRQSVITEA